MQKKKRVTWQRCTKGRKGIQFEPVHHVAAMEHLYGHKGSTYEQQRDVQTLCYDAKPQHILAAEFGSGRK